MRQNDVQFYRGALLVDRRDPVALGIHLNEHREDVNGLNEVTDSYSSQMLLFSLKEGRSLLYYAVSKGATEVVSTLISAGADVNLSGNVRWLINFLRDSFAGRMVALLCTGRRQTATSTLLRFLYRPELIFGDQQSSVALPFT
jgi:hypothetical protein